MSDIFGTIPMNGKLIVLYDKSQLHENGKFSSLIFIPL